MHAHAAHRLPHTDIRRQTETLGKPARRKRARMAAMSFAVPIARSALPRLASDSIITCMACMHVYVCVGGGGEGGMGA